MLLRGRFETCPYKASHTEIFQKTTVLQEILVKESTPNWEGIDDEILFRTRRTNRK